MSLVPYEEYFTFEKLINPPEYSIKAGTYLGATCLKTYSGKPWEIFKENGFVFNFITDQVVQKSTINNPILLDVAGSGRYFISNGLILPGSLTDAGKITSYTAFYSFEKSRFRYSEVTHD